MKFTLIHTVSAEVEITRDQLDVLLVLSASHYDYTCRSASFKAGQSNGYADGHQWIQNGLLTILSNMMADGSMVRYVFSSREIDLLMKILEFGRSPVSSALSLKFLYIFRRMADDQTNRTDRVLELEVPSGN